MDMITKLSTALNSAIVIKFGKEALPMPHKVVNTKLALELSLDYEKFCNAVTLFEKLCEEYLHKNIKTHPLEWHKHAFQKWSRPF